MMVAAGGGGMGGGTQDAIGGAGGCPNGQAGTSPFGQGGGGATTTAGGNGGPPWITSGNAGTAGSLGLGGNGGTDPCYNNSPGGGGGGGLYGGGGGGSDCFSSEPYGGGSGGGGSSLVPAGATCATGASGNATNGSLTITYTIGSGTATPTNTGPYCVGQTIQLNSIAATTYSWSGPNGFSSTLQNPTLPNATAANAGVYTLTTVQNGCTSTGTTTVVVNPLPNVNAGPDVSVCQNGSVTLTASGATSYSWSPGGQTTASILVSPAVTTTYTLTGTSSGCVNTDQVVVTVNPIPTVNAGPDVSICANGNTTLTATGATTYSWAPGGQTTASITVAPVTETTYTVTGTALGCTNSDQVVVMVLATASINAGPDVSICQGTSTVLSASGGVTYTWNNGVGSGNGISVNPNVTTTYTVSGTDANGCIGSDDVLVTVNMLPNVNAGTDQTLCDGSLVALSGNGATTYTWNNGVSNGVPFSQPVGNITYTLTGTDANGCVNTDDVQVTVVANPIPVITGPTQYCSLNPPFLSTVASYASYSWSTGVSTSTATVTEGDNPITVTVTTIQGCSGVSTQHIVQEQPAFQTSGSITICAGQSAMIHGVSQTEAGDYTGNFQTALGCDSVSVITLNVNPLPPVFAGNDIVVCQGNGIVLNATGANSYTWTGGVSNNVQFTPSVGAITYTVTGTSTNGCVNTDQVVVTVNALPIVNAGNDQSVCAGQSAVLTATGANNYVWSNGVTNGGAFMPSQTATYTVTGTDANGCVNSDNLTIVVNPVPTVFAGNNLTVCEGASVTLSGSGATTYSWTGGVTHGVSFVPAAGLNSYTVTGTTSNGCTSTDEVTVFVDLAPDVNFTIDNNLGCVPLTINLTAVGDDLNNCLWSSTSGNWSFNCGSAQMTIIQGGCFDITLSATSSSGCTGSFTANNIVCAEEAPNASFTVVPGSVSWTDPAVAMINSTYGASSYEWYFGDNSPMSTQFQPEHTYPVDVADNYTVMLLAFSPIGCVDTAYSSVEVYEDLIFYVPNTFTPDGDIYNQIFRPVFTSGYDPFDYQLLIFNRWGETIFESNDSNVGWDGTYGLGDMARYVQDGTYVWRIEFKLKRNDSRKIVSGHVNVIR
jgi:gliding motility-associated-like protein